MDREQVIAKLQPIFDNIFLEKVVLTPALSSADVEEWDSLLQISIVVATEESFGVRFRVGEVEATNNVGEFADLILQRMAG